MTRRQQSTGPTLKALLAAPDGRRRGEEHHSAKLTRALVRTIREALELGVAPATLARETGVSRQSIGDIRDEKTWKE